MEQKGPPAAEHFEQQQISCLLKEASIISLRKDPDGVIPPDCCLRKSSSRLSYRSTRTSNDSTRFGEQAQRSVLLCEGLHVRQTRPCELRHPSKQLAPSSSLMGEKGQSQALCICCRCQHADAFRMCAILTSGTQPICV